MRKHAIALTFLLVASACGNGPDSAPTTTTATPTTTTATPTTTTATPTTTTATPTTTTATPTTTSDDSTWDMCLVTAPAGRRYEWLNHETWMSLERQRREIPNSLRAWTSTPYGGGITTASAASREAGDHVALIDGFVDAHCDLIVTIGAEMGEATTASARRHPDVDFIGIDQFHDEELPNLAGLVFPEDRAGFLVGVLAASATVTGIVAVVLDSGTEPSSVAYGTGFANGVAHVDPDVEVLSIVHPGDGEEPDAEWGATAAREALDGGADVVFGPGSGSGRGVLVEVAGTGYDARNGALCIGAEVDDFLQVITARRCLLTSVLKLPNEFHDMYWVPGRPAVIKQYEDALDLPAEYESEHAHSTLALINQEFLLGGTPSGGHVGPVGLHFFNRWGAHKTGVPNRTFSPSDDLKSMLAVLTEALWTGEVAASLTATTTAVSPASDPDNDGGWVLRPDLSDEFDSGSVDLEKWSIAGDPDNAEQLDNSDGSAADWVGRAPGVFDPTNAVVQDGKLQLLIEWEPSSAMFPVLDNDGDPMLDADCDCPYENYTVGGLVSRNSLQYGYAEIRAKAAPLPVSSAFWMIGNHFEIDVFEMIGEAGDGPDGSGAGYNHMMPTTIHNWDVGDLDDNGYGEEYELEWNVAKDFHTYGAEWTSDAVIFYADGQEVGRITQQEAGLIWNTEELHIWIDNEVFIWEGLPSPDRLPSEFLVDYVRVWQQ